jgi:valyl-tRNA synthetase
MGRAYEGGAPGASAHAALQLALGVYLRLFAPFLPFVTEEVWSWWREGSVHRNRWPGVEELEEYAGEKAILAITGTVLSEVRRAKSDAKASMAADVEKVSVTAPVDELDLLRKAEGDLKAAARTGVIHYSEGEFAVESVLSGSTV